MHKSSDLKLYGDYSRKDVHDIFDPKGIFTPQAGTWGLHGLVKIPGTVADFVFFVTYGQSQADHKFKESISIKGVIDWQSQPRQGLNDQKVLRWINQKQNQDKIYLFVRPKKGELYSLLGNIEYLSHDKDKEKPVHFKFQILSWKPTNSIINLFCNASKVEANNLTIYLNKKDKAKFDNLSKFYRDILISLDNGNLLKALLSIDNFIAFKSFKSQMLFPEDQAIKEAIVSKWFKKEGDFVVEDEAVVELETDEEILELVADISGKILSIDVSLGDPVKVGDSLAMITTIPPNLSLYEILDVIHKNKDSKLLLFDGDPDLKGSYEIIWNANKGDFIKKGEKIFSTKKQGLFGSTNNTQFAEESFFIQEIFVNNGFKEVNGCTPMALINSAENITQTKSSEKLIQKPNSADAYLKEFVMQAWSGNLKTSHFPKEDYNLKMKVSFGQGASARVPWISFTASGISVSNGYYPVYLYYKQLNILILSYGISETSKHKTGWPDEITKAKTKISDFINEPPRYGSSFVFKSYKVIISNEEVHFEYEDEKLSPELDNDLAIITSYYKSLVENQNLDKIKDVSKKIPLELLDHQRNISGSPRPSEAIFMDVQSHIDKIPELKEQNLNEDAYKILFNFMSLFNKISNDKNHQDVLQGTDFKKTLDELLIKYDAEIIFDQLGQFDDERHEIAKRIKMNDSSSEYSNNDIYEPKEAGLIVKGKVFKKQLVDITVVESKVDKSSLENEEAIIDHIIKNPEKFNMNEGYRFEKFYDFDGEDFADLICFGPGKEVKIFGVTNKKDHESIKKAKKVKHWNNLLAYEQDEVEGNSFFKNYLVSLSEIPMTKKFCNDYKVNYVLL